MINVIKIRAEIDEKVERQKRIEADENEEEYEPIDPNKIKLSRRSWNFEGLTEREMKEREQRGEFPCYNYKKRKLYQLSADEIEKIVDGCLKDYLG